jgi:hypothetical protein
MLASGWVVFLLGIAVGRCNFVYSSRLPVFAMEEEEASMPSVAHLQY